MMKKEERSMCNVQRIKERVKKRRGEKSRGKRGGVGGCAKREGSSRDVYKELEDEAFVGCRR